MSGQKSIQILSVAQIVREAKPVSGEVCPLCGGPAEVDLFWSTSKDNPGVKVLKKQTCCGGHPRRTSRYHSSERVMAHCPVRVEIVVTEMETPAAELPEPETVTLRLVPADRVGDSGKVVAHCPVPVKIVTSEMEAPAAELPEPILVQEEETSLEEPETVVLRLVPAQDPSPPASRDPVGDLDAVLSFLSGCPDEALDEIGRLAELTREFKARRLGLKLRPVGVPR